MVEGATGGPRDVAPVRLRRAAQPLQAAPTSPTTATTWTSPPPSSEAGEADLFAFGRPFISNPDLVERLKSGAPLAQLNPATLYGGGAAGYTDYPMLAEAR